MLSIHLLDLGLCIYLIILMFLILIMFFVFLNYRSKNVYFLFHFLPFLFVNCISNHCLTISFIFFKIKIILNVLCFLFGIYKFSSRSSYAFFRIYRAFIMRYFKSLLQFIHCREIFNFFEVFLLLIKLSFIEEILRFVNV